MEFFDGFEQFRTGDKIATNSLLAMAGYAAFGEIGSGIGRLPGSTSMYTLTSRIEKTWTWSGDTLSIGFACRQAGRGGLLSLKLDPQANGLDPHTVVYNDPLTGLVTIRNTDHAEEVGYVTPLKQRWYYYEFVITRSTSTMVVFVNGKEDVRFGIDPAITAAANVIITLNPFNFMTFFPPEAEYKEAGMLFDDLYIRDGGRLGPVQISGRLPTADVSTEWNVSTASGTGLHFLQVGMLPPDLANRFIFTAENGKLDSFKSLGTLPENGDLISHGVIALVRKATADPVSVVTNVNDTTVTIDNVGRKWEYRYTLMSVDGWSIEDVQSAVFGVRSVI